MPFILCTTICCCLPCIISVLGFREDFAQNRGATPESINSLPTYKFKVKKHKSGNDKENSSGTSEGGIVGAGTEKERLISGEDAVSFILSLGHEFLSWFVDFNILIHCIVLFSLLSILVINGSDSIRHAETGLCLSVTFNCSIILQGEIRKYISGGGKKNIMIGR